MTNNERAAIEIQMERAVRDFLDHRERYEEGADNDGDARMEVAALLKAVSHVIGNPVLQGALGTVSPGSSRSDVLDHVALRSSILSSLCPQLDDAASLIEVSIEAAAVAAGDTPYLFARIGKKKVKYREYREKLAALCWERVLDKAGLSVRDRQHAIEGAYAVSWDAVRGWEADTRKNLGDTIVDKELNRASRLISNARRLPDDWRDKLARDGQRAREAALRSRSAAD